MKENFPLIDLGAHYYIAKFQKQESMQSVLQNGPWFIFGHFLSCQRWELNFIATEAKQTLTVVWLRLPNLPTEFYDGSILQGNSIGRLLKIDACTSATLRGRYARLCVELPMDQPVAKFIYIEDYKQQIEYEGDKVLCKSCGVLGHTTINCPNTLTTLPDKMINEKAASIHKGDQKSHMFNNDNGWHTVSFQKSRRLPKKGPVEGKETSLEAGIDVKIFNASTGKYINTQKLKFVNKDTSSLDSSQNSKKQA